VSTRILGEVVHAPRSQGLVAPDRATTRTEELIGRIGAAPKADVEDA
jgi:hypothetical protein